MNQEILSIFHTQGIIPILRNDTPEDAIATALACLQEGASVVELTTTIPDVIKVARILVAEGMTVGIGTLRSADELDEVAESGASFAVSYFQPPSFVKRSNDLGLMPIPGVLTPSEMQSAATAGAGVLKIFPAWQSHPRIIADLRPLIAGVSYLVTGGLTPPSIRDWLDAGAIAAGVGRPIGTVGRDGEAGVRANTQALLNLARARTGAER